MKKRIACISHSLEIGGGELAFLEMVRSLENYDVVAIVPDVQGSLQAMTTQREVLQIVQPMDWWFGEPLTLKQKIKLLRNVGRQVYQLRNILMRECIDVVIVNTIASPVGALAAKMANIPCVWFLHELADDPPYRLQLGDKFSKKLVGRLADKVVCNSHYTMEHYEQYIDARKMSVAYQAVDMIVPKITTTSLGLLRVGIVGRMSIQKNQLFAVQTVATMEGVILRVAGADNNEYATQLQEEVEKLQCGDKVEFCGVVNDMADFYSTVDVVFACGKRETLGRSVIEAMKCGKAVVTAHDCGYKELIEDGKTGVIFEVDNIESAQVAIEQMKDEVLRMRLAKNAQIWANETFNIQQFGCSMRDIIEQCVK